MRAAPDGPGPVRETAAAPGGSWRSRPLPANARTRPVEHDDGTRLIGLVSWGVGCQDFTVFTKVWAYKGWIDSVVGN